MSTRSIFTLSGMLSRSLALAVKSIPNKAAKVPLAAGYGICELLGAGTLFSILWPVLQSTLRERLANVSSNASNEQSSKAGKQETTHDYIP